MDKKTLGAIAFLIGVAILVNSLLADGIGIGNHPDFGSNQLIGTSIGASMTAIGLYLMIRSK